MIKRLVPLALLAAWIPQAHAFPPCPLDPMEYGPPPGEAASAGDASVTTESGVRTPPWFKADYQFAGNPAILGLIAPQSADGTAIEAERAKCRDPNALPVLASHASSGILQLNPDYAPMSGFAVIDLPYLPHVATDGLDVQYRLRFTVDNKPLQDPEDWLDIAQLDFFRNGSAGMKYSQAVSTIYRVRKVQRNRSYASIEIIESRADISDISIRPPLTDRVVAVIPLPSDQPNSAIGLRWSQHATQLNDDDIVYDEFDIDGLFEVLGPNDQPLFSMQLPGQWASLVSMGLLDYNIEDISTYENGEVAELRNMTLGAKRVD